MSNKPNLIKRSRYYQSLIDLNNLQEGEDYEKLKESYIIFICTFDLFKKGLPRYTFENVCQEDNGLKLDDGVRKIFFNTKDFGKAKNVNLQAFLMYVNGEMVNNKLVKKLDKKVKSIKNNEEWRREFMAMRVKELDIAKEHYSLGMKEGEERGIQQGMIKQINALKEFNISNDKIISKIVSDYNVAKEEIEKYL